MTTPAQKMRGIFSGKLYCSLDVAEQHDLNKHPLKSAARNRWCDSFFFFFKCVQCWWSCFCDCINWTPFKFKFNSSLHHDWSNHTVKQLHLHLNVFQEWNLTWYFDIKVFFLIQFVLLTYINEILCYIFANKKVVKENVTHRIDEPLLSDISQLKDRINWLMFLLKNTIFYVDLKASTGWRETN